MRIGIIGHGRLGRLLSKYLIQDFSLRIFDIHDKQADISSIGAQATTLDEACDCPVVIPMVPIGEMQSVLSQMAPHLKPQTLVIDVCSVKTKPVQWMLETLPETIQILGTHPMFGPDSAPDTLFGNKIVLSRVRVEEKLYSDIRFYLERHGLKVLEVTPDEHDREIAHSLLLTHFIGRGLMQFGAKELQIDTKGYRRLMKILGTVQNDSWQLFEDMNHFNPYAQQTLSHFIEGLKHIREKV